VNVASRSTAQPAAILMRDGPYWQCEACKFPLEGNDGYLAVSYNDIHRYRGEIDAWERKYGNSRIYTLAHLVGHPEPVRWHVRHDRCGSVENPYAIDSGRIQSWRDVVGWTAHLASKTWTAWSDWSQLLYRAGADHP
jgi:hypothetical protein